MEEEKEEKQSESPLYSDFDRLGNMLTDAMNLSKENRDYNPATLRDYFVILAEIERFLYPLFGDSPKMLAIKKDLKSLDGITRVAYQRLLTDKNYKISSKIFGALSDIHQELLILKQDANLGIKVRTSLSSKKKLTAALE